MSTVAISERVSDPITATAGQTDFEAGFPPPAPVSGVYTGVVVSRLRAPATIPDTLVLGADFTLVSILADTFTARLNTGAQVGDVIRVVGLGKESRQSTYVAGSLNSAALEAEFTRQSMRLQEHDRDISRALVSPLGEAGLALPSAASRASKILGFDADGDLTLTDVASDLVNYVEGSVNSVHRLVSDRLRDRVSLEDFGAAGDMVADDTDAINHALASLGAGGGVVYASPRKRYRVNGNLVFPPNTSLCMPGRRPGSNGTNSGYDYSRIGGLYTSDTTTFTLHANAGLVGILCQRQGLTYPITADQLAAFTGDLCIVAGDDVFVTDCMFLGYNLALVSDGFQRVIFERNKGDNNGFIQISACYDVSRITDNHAWCFTSVGTAVTTQRPGTAYAFENVNDWNQVRGNFSYDYYKSISIIDCSGIQIASHEADGSGTFVGQNGVYISGASQGNSIIGGTINNQERSVRLETDANSSNIIEGVTFAGNNTTSNSCVSVGSGDAIVSGCTFVYVRVGIGVDTAVSKVKISGNFFKLISNIPIYFAQQNSNSLITDDNFWVDGNIGSYLVNTNYIHATIASNSNLNLPTDNYSFAVSGGATIDNIIGGISDREITLYFSSSLTISLSGNIKPIEAAPISVNAGDAIKFKFDGVNWRQVSPAKLITQTITSGDIAHAPSSAAVYSALAGNRALYHIPEEFGAIGDGTAHPLSERYASLTLAQVDFPFATALTQTIDWAAIQKGLSAGYSLIIPNKTYVLNYRLIMHSFFQDLVGSSRNGSVLKFTQNNSTYISIGDRTSSVVEYLSIQNLRIDGDQSLANVLGIDIENANHVYINNCFLSQIYNGISSGSVAIACQSVCISNNRIDTPNVANAVAIELINGNGLTIDSNELELIAGAPAAASTIGLLVSVSGGNTMDTLVVRNNLVQRFYYNERIIVANAGSALIDVWHSDNIFDLASTTSLFLVAKDNALIRSFYSTQDWWSGVGTSMHIDANSGGTIADIAFHGTRAHQSNLNVCEVFGATTFARFINCSFNAAGGIAGTGYAALLYAAGEYLTILGGKYQGQDTTGAFATYPGQYGILVTSDISNYSIKDAVVHAAAGGSPILVTAHSAPSANRSIRNCMGFLPTYTVALAGTGVPIYNYSAYEIDIYIGSNGAGVSISINGGSSLLYIGLIRLAPGMYFTPTYTSAPSITCVVYQ